MNRLFTILIVSAMVLGVGVGWAVNQYATPAGAKVVAENLSIVTDVFLRLIKMIIAPLVFSTLVAGIAHMEDSASIGRVGIKALGWFVSASIVSLTIGLIMVHLLHPGSGLSLPMPDPAKATAAVDMTKFSLKSFIPHIVVTHPLVPDDNLVIYREFGRLFNCADGARSLEREFQAARSDLVEKIGDLRKLKVLYLIWKDPWFAVSRDTYVSALLALANLETVPASADVRYPTLATTHSAWQEADCVLLSSEPFAFRQQHADALSHSLQPPKPVMLVDGELMSWYGSRAIEGLRYLPGLRSQVEALIGG